MTDEREKFEAWMLAFFPSADLTRGRDSRYIVTKTETRWQGWAARAEQKDDLQKRVERLENRMLAAERMKK